MPRLRDHPRALLVVATILAVAGVVVISGIAGFGSVGSAFGRFHWPWVLLAIGAQPVAFAGYVVAYRCVASLNDGPTISLRLAARLVVAGFGAFALRGGFGLDVRALRGLSDQPQRSMIRVLGLGALEWAVLAPVACVLSIGLLVSGSGAQPSLLWSWTIAVPVGFAAGLAAGTPERVDRLMDAGGWREKLGTALGGVAVLRRLGGRPGMHAASWAGMTLYWVGDIASFYGAVRAFDVHLSLPAIIVAYATGYLATRRTLPLGGAFVTEILMAAALHWVGAPLAAGIPAVVVYRIVSFALPMAPALAARSDIDRLVRRGERIGDEGPAAPPPARRRAGLAS